jgi:hypothetical protein
LKKYLLFFLALVIGGLLVLLFEEVPDRNFVSIPKGTYHKKDFVSMGENSFELHGKNFYPMAVNYIASMQTDGNDYWPRPTVDYAIDSSGINQSKKQSLEALQADMMLIREMGFNTVRIVGFTEAGIEQDSNRYSKLLARAHTQDNNYADLPLLDTTNDRKYFNAIALLLKEVNKAGLKAILTLRIRPDVLTTEFLLDRLTHYFKNDATIFAYDLFNEPLYFDRPNREKKEIYAVTRRWKKICKHNSPHQLVTIGLEGIREAHAWDPHIINVDFISFHPYEYEPEQVRNEIYWYSKHVKRPWMIAETAIPADNDTVPYEKQKQFAGKTLKQTYDCGAWGYSWWQYKDVKWQRFHASFMGVLNRLGQTKVPNTNLIVNGSVKPVAEEFKLFTSGTKKDNCLCLSNYYNYSEHQDCRVSGILLDEKNKPIVGGVILAWNENWTHSYHTITKDDGSFEVRGNFPFYHWIASANGYSRVRGDLKPDTASMGTDGIPTMDLGKLKIKSLSILD